MPTKKRHSIHDLGAVAAAGDTPAIDVSEFTKGILYMDRDTGDAVVTALVSPDGGTTWHTYYDADENLIQFTSSAAVPNVAVGIAITAKLMKFNVAAFAIGGLWFEGIREIA